jgi:N-formylglutamate amidohydrolase
MVPDVYRLFAPLKQTTAVVFASPHSGCAYAPGFLAQSVLDTQAIRSSEDAFVDRLFDMAPDLGAPLLAARAPDELDPCLIEGIARAPHNPRVSSGLGVIPRVVAGGRAIYRGKLALAEAEARIAGYWHPYHQALRRVLDATHAGFGEVVLIDCHSMPHEAIAGHTKTGAARPEVVLGDRFGAAAGREVMEQVEAAFSSAGFRVVRNTPFAGAFISQSYGRPSVRRHVVQVEIDRSLYMDEVRIEPLAGFADFRHRLGGVVAEIADIGRQALPLAAE